MHASRAVALGHLLMDDAAASGHPLHVPRAECPAIAKTVRVVDVSAEYVRNGLDAPMRMPREACEVVLRHIVTKIVEQKEWIELFSCAEAKSAAEMDACTLHGRL